MIHQLLIIILMISADPVIYIEGTVVAFDQKTVTLKQTNGATVHLPRAALKQKTGIKVGQQIVRLAIKPSDLLQNNPKIKTK